MDEQVLLKQQQESNINVKEEKSYLSGPWTALTKIAGYGEENPGEAPPFYKRILLNILPLFKALVIISLFLVNGYFSKKLFKDISKLELSEINSAFAFSYCL